MTWPPERVQFELEKILPLVQKPGRYTGGELNQVVKAWDAVQTHVAFVFPDVYDLGMSNLGMAVLYDQLNQRPDTWAERVFSPWPDMEAQMRRVGMPLYSLESKHALKDFDIVGFSLPYETLYTNSLNALDLGGIPIFAEQRGPDDPLIIAGGHAAYNPEPIHAFFDAFVLGEGEEVIHEIVEAYQDWKHRGASRRALLETLARIWGVYVPAFYEPHYHEDGTLASIERTWDGAPEVVQKRIVAKLPPPPKHPIVPYVDITHNRVPIEIMRGCTRGCRFCHAGMVNRPVRERPVEEVLNAIEQAIHNTGIEEIGLLSLSSSDYTHVLDLVQQATKRFANQHINLSLPSMRIESFSVDLMDALQSSRRGGFTLAPEAATERMRNTINKPVSTEQLLETARAIYSRGWHTIKLYFMIGHPSETLEDVQAIADLAKAVREEGRKIIGGRAKVHAGVSTFVPKPHTPFQWVPCDTLEQIQAKQELLQQEMRGKGLKLNWNNPYETMVEAFLSRGDRRLAKVIYGAWQRGAKFDAWHEYFRYDFWMEAFAESGLDPAFYTHRERNIDEIFPWEHLSTTVRKRFLAQDYMWSQQQKTRIDCRHQCFACGILPTFKELRIANPGSVWQCPEVKPKAHRHSVPVIQTQG